MRSGIPHVPTVAEPQSPRACRVLRSHGHMCPPSQQRQFNARVERALTSALHTNLHLKAALVDSYGFAVQVRAPAVQSVPPLSATHNRSDKRLVSTPARPYAALLSTQYLPLDGSFTSTITQLDYCDKQPAHRSLQISTPCFLQPPCTAATSAHAPYPCTHPQAVRSSKDRKRAAVLWSCSPQAEEACAAALQRYGGRVRAGVAAALGAPMVPALDYRHAALAGEQRRAEELLDAIGREAADGGAGQGAGVEEAKGHRGAPLGGQVLERELGQGRAEEDDTGERPPAGDGRRRGSELMGGSSEETSRGLGVGLRRDNVSVGESRGGGGGDGGVPADALDAAARSLLGGLRPKPRTRGRRQGT